MKYALIKVNLRHGYYIGDMCFDIDSFDNLSLIKILDLSEKDVEYYKKCIMIQNQLVSESINNEDPIYRLIPINDKLEIISDEFKILNDVVIQCEFKNIEDIENKNLIKVDIQSLQSIKKKLRNIPKINKPLIDNIENNTGCYTHLASAIYCKRPHYLYFFNIDLNNMLLENSYEEFENYMRDKAYDIMTTYLDNYYNGNKNELDYNSIIAVFNDKEFLSII